MGDVIGGARTVSESAGSRHRQPTPESRQAQGRMGDVIGGARCAARVHSRTGMCATAVRAVRTLSEPRCSPCGCAGDESETRLL
eukprot:2005849-Prymnesium_polylepis.1